MSLGGKLIAFYALHILTLTIYLIIRCFTDLSWWQIPALIFVIYLWPILCFRLHNYFFPLMDGTYNLAEKKYNSWWGGHQIQFIFIAIPWLEAPLHFIPGLFSLWLRLWGSRVGKNVYWTPRVEILDRSLLKIGANVLVGHKTVFVSHVVVKKHNGPILIIKTINVEEGALIGAASEIGPGATIEKNQILKAKTSLFWKGRYENLLQ